MLWNNFRYWFGLLLLAVTLGGGLALADEAGETATADDNAAWLEGVGAKFQRSNAGEVQYVSFMETEVTTETLERVAGLPWLLGLSFHSAAVTAKGFDALAGAKKLETVSLYKMDASGLDFGVLGRLPRLNALIIERTAVGKTAIAGLLPGKNLERLTLRTMAVDDDDLVAIGKLPALESLDLRRTKITSAGVAHLAGAKQLVDLNLAETRVDNEALPFLEGLTGLRVLRLRQTLVTGAGVAQMQLPPRLQVFSGDELDLAAFKHLAALDGLRELRAFGSKIGEAEAAVLATKRKLELDVYEADAAPGIVEKLEEAGLRVTALTKPKRVLPKKKAGGKPVPPKPRDLGAVVMGRISAEKDLQWRVHEGGEVVVIRGESERLHEPKKVFWLDDLRMKATTAAGDVLWFGTNKGLLIYDPAADSWSRMAIDAELVEADVEKLTVTADELVVDYNGGEEARFDLEARRWVVAEPAAMLADDPAAAAAAAPAAATGLPIWPLAVGGLGICLIIGGGVCLARRSRS